jgi:hypothetical protein
VTHDSDVSPGTRLPPALVLRAKENRTELAHGLKATEDLAREISAWRAGDLYRASGKPEVVLNLRQAGDGSVMGWAQGSDGRFIGQARWTKATAWGSRVISSAAVLTGHVMLVEISQKLDRIETKIDRVREALSDDRRQALKAAIDQVETALGCDPATGRGLLVAAAAPLRTAVGQEIQALARSIERVPTPSRWHAVKAVWDTASDTRRDLSSGEGSLLAVLQGISALTRLYMALDEVRTAWRAAHDLLLQLAEAGLQNAWWKARKLFPKDQRDQPEAFWTRAMAMIAEARAQALTFSRAETIDLDLCLTGAELALVTGDLRDDSSRS